MSYRQKVEEVKEKLANSSTSPQNFIKAKRHLPVFANCELCGKSMRQDSLRRHRKDIHNENTSHNAVFVDKNTGIFLVKKCNHGGIGFQIHVQKLIQPDGYSFIEVIETTCVSENNMCFGTTRSY